MRAIKKASRFGTFPLLPIREQEDLRFRRSVGERAGEVEGKRGLERRGEEAKEEEKEKEEEEEISDLLSCSFLFPERTYGRTDGAEIRFPTHRSLPFFLFLSISTTKSDFPHDARRRRQNLRRSTCRFHLRFIWEFVVPPPRLPSSLPPSPIPFPPIFLLLARYQRDTHARPRSRKGEKTFFCV